MRGSVLVKSTGYLLRKGDGNEAYVQDEFGNYHRVFQRFPPPEAHFDDPNTPDIPFTAHTGTLHSEETGVPGTGKLIPGNFALGEFDEVVYVGDDGSMHWHGMDAVIKALGRKFKELDVDLDPGEIIEAAIDLHNEGQHESGANHLPTHMDPAWRKTTMGPFQHDGHEGQTRGNWGPDKRLVTVTDNANWRNHRFGRFIESAAVPFNNELGEVLTQRLMEKGIVGSRAEVDKMFSFADARYPYIKTHRLHERPDANTGAMVSSAQNLSTGGLGMSGGHLDTNFGREAGFMGSTDQAFRDVSASETIHHLPDEYFMEPSAKGGTAGIARDAAHHIHLASSGTGTIGQALATGRVKSSVPMSHEALSATWKGVPLRAYLSNIDPTAAVSIDGLIQDLAHYPAFKKLFGRTTESSHAGKLDLAYASKYGTPYEETTDEEGNVTSTGHMKEGDLSVSDLTSHTHFPRDTLALPGRGKQSQASTNATEKSAAKNWAKAIASGRNPEAKPGMADSMFRVDKLPDSPDGKGLIGVDADGNEFRVNLHQDSRAKAAEVRGIIEALADHQALAGGREPRKMYPAPEEIPTNPVWSHQIDDSKVIDRKAAAAQSIPEHFAHRFVERVPVPGAAQSAGDTATSEPAQHIPRGTVQTETAPVGVLQGPPTARMPANPTAVQQRRMSMADAPLEDIRGIASSISGPERAARMTAAELEAARRVISDPLQTNLMQFQTSDDVLESTQDRLLKTMERMQMTDALGDVAVRKALPQKRMSPDSIADVNFMASHVEIAPIDIQTIVFAKGDWMRLTNRYGYPENTVKVVKAAFRSD